MMTSLCDFWIFGIGRGAEVEAEVELINVIDLLRRRYMYIISRFHVKEGMVIVNVSEGIPRFDGMNGVEDGKIWF